jgi:hypothetical protein
MMRMELERTDAAKQEGSIYCMERGLGLIDEALNGQQRDVLTNSSAIPAQMVGWLR